MTVLKQCKETEGILIVKAIITRFTSKYFRLIQLTEMDQGAVEGVKIFTGRVFLAVNVWGAGEDTRIILFFFLNNNNKCEHALSQKPRRGIAAPQRAEKIILSASKYSIRKRFSRWVKYLL